MTKPKDHPPQNLETGEMWRNPCRELRRSSCTGLISIPLTHCHCKAFVHMTFSLLGVLHPVPCQLYVASYLDTLQMAAHIMAFDTLPGLTAPFTYQCSPQDFTTVPACPSQLYHSCKSAFIYKIFDIWCLSHHSWCLQRLESKMETSLLYLQCPA